MRSKALIILMALGAMSAGLYAAPAYHSISGQVTGMVPGHGATVHALGARSYTAAVRADGSWEIPNVAPGDYRVNLTGANYTFTPSYRSVSVKNADTHNVAFTAHPKSGAGAGAGAAQSSERFEMTGRVTGLEAAHRATIRASGPRSYSATTRADGTWSIQNVFPGIYNVNATHSRYRISPEFHRADLSHHDVHNLNFHADPLPGQSAASGGSKKQAK
jgi:hypothetical protein